MLPMFADIKSLEGKMKRKRFGQRVFAWRIVQEWTIYGW